MLKMFMEKINYVIIIYTLLLIGSWGWFLYGENKPKTSVDLVDHMYINQEISSLITNNASVSEEDFNTFKNYFDGEDLLKVSQYTILKYEDNFLLIETTPGLINNQLYIKNMRSIESNEFKRILED